MEILLFVIFTLLGLSIGSFLNVLIDRLPARKSLVHPSSHCDACEHKLSFFDYAFYGLKSAAVLSSFYPTGVSD